MFKKRKSVSTIRKSSKGRNLKFRDNSTSKTMSRSEFVRAIKDGKYPGYHIRDINGVKTPVSNPDGKEENNLD